MFINKLEKKSIRTYNYTKVIPTDVDYRQRWGYGANPPIGVTKPLIVDFRSGGGSGKLATIYLRYIRQEYAKFGNFSDLEHSAS